MTPTVRTNSGLAPAARPRFTVRRAARAAALLAGLVVAWQAVRIFAFGNQHAVIPGMVYRCAQPGPGELRDLIAAHGIRTVVNLRGYSPHPPAPWYLAEARATSAAGVDQEDLTFSARALPPPAELKRLVEVFDGATYPILLHCKQGADRTGLAAALSLLLHTDATLARARRQLLPWYGHIALGPTAAMDDFFTRYESWLAGRPHAAALLRDWIAHHYSPGPAVGTITPNTPGPYSVAANQWLAIPIRAANRSAEPWHFQPGGQAGIHVAYTVQGPDGKYAHKDQAGLLRATVAPGGDIALTLAVPPLRVPGEYLLRADLVDATAAGVPVRAAPFYKFGAVPLLLLIQVH